MENPLPPILHLPQVVLCSLIRGKRCLRRRRGRKKAPVALSPCQKETFLPSQVALGEVVECLTVSHSRMMKNRTRELPWGFPREWGAIQNQVVLYCREGLCVHVQNNTLRALQASECARSLSECFRKGSALSWLH